MTATTISATGFALLAVVAIVLDQRGRRLPGAAPAVSALTAAMRTTPGRITVLAVWIWLGVHFLAR